MPLIEANGLRLHVQELGDGPPVVMLHGVLLDSLATWYFTVAPRLARRHRVVLLDWRGHGRSERPATGYGLRSLARDVAAVVDELRLERPAVVGFSYGGTVALRYAADRPDDVGRLAVVDAPLPLAGPRGLAWLERPLEDQPFEEWLEVVPAGQRALFARDGRRARRLWEQISRLYSETSLRDDIAADPDVADEELARIACPVLLAYGSRSPYGYSRNRLERVLTDTRRADPDAGHFVPVEAPGPLADALESFLHA